MLGGRGGFVDFHFYITIFLNLALVILIQVLVH